MECKQCGHCCRALIIEINHLDIVREPKLAEHAEAMQGGEIFCLTAGYRPCPFLNVNIGGITDNNCKIYPTRPNVCVAMEAGGEQCKFEEVKKSK